MNQKFPTVSPSRIIALTVFGCALGALWTNTQSPRVRAQAQVQTQVLAAHQITTASLLSEMADLGSMAEFPSASYTTKQFSSYDRTSNAPRWDWFANNDHGQYLRVEERDGRQEKVMMDAQGPGAVVRIWSANPDGTLRVYLDGAITPAIEAPMKELLDGKVQGFPMPMAGERARGHNLYFPIAYAKSCKITMDGGDIYYTIAYRTYPKNTPVETFQRAHLNQFAPQIKTTAARLENPRAQGVTPNQTRKFDLNLAAGATQTLGEWKGALAITDFLMRTNSDISDEALRGVVLRFNFDGEETVEAPLGDFFGTAPGQNPYSALPSGITEGGEMWSHWVMPFARSARVSVQNMGAKAVKLNGQLGTKPYVWTPNSMHFHANFIARHDIATRPFRDFTMLGAQGQGVFAGLSYAVDNPNVKWWGEGDEKVYVDGESFPSWFGTGSEDYFGYAWCDTTEFTHAYHAQPRADGPGSCGPGRGHWGRASDVRFHIFDRIPFEQSMQFDMELSHWVETKINLATVAYWYAKPGAADSFAPLRPSDLQVLAMPEYEGAPKVAGAIEGETMRVASNSSQSAKANVQAWEGLSGGEQLWWHDLLQIGEELRLNFDAPAPGRYRVFGRFLKARDYGVHQLSINGRTIGEPRDFYAPEVTITPEIELGIFALKDKNNQFEVKVNGTNAQSAGALFGLDYLRLEPIEG